MTARAPDIRYVTTADGVSIACWSVGEGPPIAITHNFLLSHAELEWEMPRLRDFYATLGSHYQVIRFDPRMAGVSQHTAPSLSLESMCLDIDAVADEFGLNTFALMGISVMGPVVIEYAASRPDRVSSLILGDGVVAVAQAKVAELVKGSVALAEATSPAFAMDVFAPHWFDPGEMEIAKKITTAGYERFPLFAAEAMKWDASSRLNAIRCPTLILAAATTVGGDAQQARQLATEIADSHLVRLDGALAPYWVDRMAAINAITEHLGGPSVNPLPSSSLQAVVFTDVVGSTEHANVVGDAMAREDARDIEALIDTQARAHRGRLVKHLGDGSLLVFDSPTSAVEFAINVQAEMREREQAMCIGLAVGEPIEEGGDLHGAVVNLAARIVAEAKAGQALVSDGTRQLLVGKPYTFEHVGDRHVKGFDEAIALYAVGRT